MSTYLTYRDNDIRLTTSVRPEYLYLATGLMVEVNGEEVATCGGFNLRDRAEGTFRGNDGGEHLITVDMESGFIAASYRLAIDGVLVSTGRMVAEDLEKTVVLGILIGIGIGLLML